MMLTDIPTPAALIDETRMKDNIARMQAHMTALGVRLRPHVKTAKCIEVARRQQAEGASGITVSTLKEAEQFFAAGFDDILYAACITPNKIDRALALRRRGCRLTVIVDSIAAAEALAARGQAEQHAFDVMIEVDTDGHRSGVKPDDALLIGIAGTLHQGGAVVKGVMTHAGSSYDLNTHEALARLAEQERSLIVEAAARLRSAGLPCPEVSVGSTPTALCARDLSDVTEVRAGVYVFFDLVMSNVGVCTPHEIALSVLTTVIGHQTEKGWVIVDAGWMAMSRDRGTARHGIDYSYGAICGQDGRSLDDYIMTAANQEHGIVCRRDGQADPDIAQRFPIGSLLRVLPNHACATGAQFSAYQLIDGERAVATWERFDGW
ncbi:DSD1 family PLP-dependent enzyme [Bradyrhizobium prioriisuperbiae]|uniref:DSD1 family PLP-dependent enzyme n=1 Tax=Bradyrhizobium prioriisuperbiae TaxID=2854389 RepID=UPI0028E1A1F9|nr:DSD1 family PLP-dependent enzyme [Bradyrhizobium prioritasuperba]